MIRASFDRNIHAESAFGQNVEDERVRNTRSKYLVTLLLNQSKGE